MNGFHERDGNVWSPNNISNGCQLQLATIIHTAFYNFRSPAGSVTLYGMNLLPEGINVTFPQLEGELEIYLLSAPNGNLKSRYTHIFILTARHLYSVLQCCKGNAWSLVPAMTKLSLEKIENVTITSTQQLM